MSDNVQLQAGVENLSLQGLNGFITILATISADDISPIALLQMEKLGAAFHVNGRYAEQTKGLLQRCDNRRLDNLALLVGWRKNDSASLMAQSTGGQAISLLSMCLSNIYSSNAVGNIFGELCLKLLPPSANIASFVQLAQVAATLAAKLNTMGFGNHLARVVAKIHDTYLALGMTAPRSLLEDIDTTFVEELLFNASEALRHDDRICRISGSYGMGYYLGLVLALFPNNTSVKVENIIIQDVENAKLRFEIIDDDKRAFVKVDLEALLSSEKLISSLVDYPMGFSIPMRSGLHFRWSGWVASFLELSFLDCSFRCNEDVLRACCNLLVLVPEALYLKEWGEYSHKQSKTNPRTRLINLLGPFPRAHMSKVCETILRMTPIEGCEGLEKAFEILVESFKVATHFSTCECKEVRNIWGDGWKLPPNIDLCNPCRLWRSLGHALEFGLYSYFIKAEPNVSIPNYKLNDRDNNLVPTALGFNLSNDTHESNLMLCIYNLLRRPGPLDIIISDESSTIYASILENLQIPSFRFIEFSLVDGKIMHNNRYYGAVRSFYSEYQRLGSETSLSSVLVPSNIGVPRDNPLFSIREDYGRLVLRCSVQYDGVETDIDMLRVIEGYIGLQWTNPCQHPTDDALDCMKYPALATSVALPEAEGKIGVFMTRHNPTAQLLSCVPKNRSVLLKDCCLNCAAEGIAQERRPLSVIIV